MQSRTLETTHTVAPNSDNNILDHPIDAYNLRSQTYARSTPFTPIFADITYRLVTHDHYALASQSVLDTQLQLAAVALYKLSIATERHNRCANRCLGVGGACVTSTVAAIVVCCKQ